MDSTFKLRNILIKFSIAVPQPLVITLTRFPSLWVLIYKYIYIYINSNESIYYPFTVIFNKCGRRWNIIDDPYACICVPNKIKSMNVKVFYLMLEENKTRISVDHKLCEFIGRLNIYGIVEFPQGLKPPKGSMVSSTIPFSTVCWMSASTRNTRGHSA